MHEDLLTALNEERINEPPIKFKYPEHETDETKKIKKIEDLPKDGESDIEDTKEIVNKIDEIEDKKSKVLIIILAVILAIALLTLLFVFVIYPALTAEKNVVIPDCTGKTVSKCEKLLHEKDLEVATKIKTTYSDSVDKNKVVKTNPESGRTVKTGTTITIYKSLGSETVELEDYVGKNSNEVKAILEVKYELEVTIEKKDVTTAVEDPDAIIEQSLPAGTKVKKGDKITLYVANQVDTFPNMQGWTRDEVDAFCTKYELKCKYVEEENTTYEEGTIYEQSIRAGSSITKGTNLTLTVAVKPKVKPTPSTSPTTTPEEVEG